DNVIVPSDNPNGGNRPGNDNTRTIYVYDWPPRKELNPECALSGPGDYERRADKLDKEGPQMPVGYGINRFSIMGFSRATWPDVMDYVRDRPGKLLLVIAPDGRWPQTFVFNSPAGHQQARIPSLPVEMGDDLRVSQYLLQSLDESGGPSPLHVRGVAAGP